MTDGRYRKHVRLAGFDYGPGQTYFVTIVTTDRTCVFGSITDGELRHSRRGSIAMNCWADLPTHHPLVELDTVIVMPNHVHGLLRLAGPVAATPASPIPTAANGPAAGSLAAVIGSYKSAVTRTINRLRPGAAARLWQPNYYEHVVRDNDSLLEIRRYIESNSLRWAEDENNPAGNGRDRITDFLRQTNQRMGDAGVAATENAL